jgi:gliding motility-associated-like protein
MKFTRYILLLSGLLTYSLSFSQADNCSFATTLSVTANCTSPVSGTSAGATASITGCAGNADDDVWYKFVATATSHQITITPSATYDPVVQLFSGACSSLTTIACQDLGGNGTAETIFATGLTIGNTYTFRVYHYGAGSGSSTFTVCVTTPPPPPANNNCGGAISLSVNAACSYTAGTSAGATQSSAGCAGTADDDVWFSFVATNSVQTITVDPSSSMDPVVQLFSGTCASMTSLYCMDNGFTNGNEVINAVGLTAGNTYYIRVYDYYNATGGAAFNICITGTATAVPTNDEPCSAIALPAVTSACNYLNFTTTGATASTATAPTPSSCGGSSPFIGGFSGTSKDVWFSITVPATGNLYITPQPGYGINDGVMALYSGTCGSLTQITCSDDYNYPGSANDFKPYIAATGLTPGATVYLRYFGYGSSSGNFGLCVSSPTNDACANALYICDINGYSASTSAAYTPDRPCNMFGNNETSAGVDQPDGTNTGGIFGQGGPWGTGSPLYDVNINNNSWIRFTAAATTASLNVTIGNCWVGNYPSGGIQMQIFSGTNCCSFVPVSDFRENSTGFTITANGLTVGQSYYLMVDGFAGDICNYTITANSGVSFPAITASTPSICYSSTSSNTVTLTAPAGATSYLWTPGGQTTQVITVSPSTTTTYTCVVEGVCGYKQTLTTTVNVNPLPSMLINSGSPVSVCNTQSVTLTATGASTYNWSTGATSSSISVSPSGNTTYTVTGTNTSTGCTATTTVNVTVLSQPSITVNSPTICSGQTATLTSNGGATATSYSWSNGVNSTNTINVSPSSATSYTVTGTGANGCTNTAVSSISVNTSPTITVNSSTICSGQTATLTSGGAATTSSYTWSDGTINTNTISVSPSSATSYTVTGTAANGCTNTAVATVNVNALPAITVNSPTICSGQTATLTSGGAASTTSYSWSTGTSGTNTISVSPTSPTSYTVTGTGANSCTNTAVANVTVNSLPTITVNSPTICFGQTATLTSAGGATSSSYTWSNGTIGTNSISVSPGSATSYTVTGIGSNSCTNTAVATVSVNSVPSISVNSATICNGQTATLTATGAASASGYNWSNGTNNINTISVSPGSPTSYTVTGTAANGCTNTAVATVSVNPLPNIAVNSGTICEGQNITLNATGGNSYSWNTGASGPSVNVSPLTLTSYTVTGTDANSCVNTAVATVTVNAIPTLSTAPTSSPSDCGLATGALTGAVANGSGPLSYSWTNSSNVIVGTSANLSNQPAGVYNLTVTSSNGCSSVFGPYNITNPGAPAAPSITAVDTVVCLGETIVLNASSTASSPTFNWTGPNSSGTTSNLTIGTSTLLDNGVYTVTVTSSGCTSPPATVNVTVNSLPIANASSSATTYCSDSTISLTGSGGTTYVWAGPNSFSSTLQNPGISPATTFMTGTYTLTVTDANGCTSSATTYLTVNQTPSTPIASADASNYCEGEPILFTSNSTGATGYTWSGPNGFTSTLQNPGITNSSVLQSGTYTVIATGNGCSSAAANVTLTVNPNPVASATVTSSVVCEGTSIDLFSAGGTNYSWTGPNSFTSTNQNPVIGSATINDSGIFIVTVFTAAGCSDTASVSILVNPTPSTPVVTASATNICEGQDLFLSSSSSGAISYSWTGPNGFISGSQNPAVLNTTVLESGTYSVIASAGVCNSASASVNVTVYANPVASATANSVVFCSGDTINLNATGGGTYSWSGPGGFTSTSQNPVVSNSGTSNSGTYTVIVSNPAGCADTASVSILVNQTPNAAMVTGDTTCIGDSLMLSAIGTGTINWYSDASLATLVQTDSSLYSPTLPANTTGTYYVTVTGNGCTSAFSTVFAYNYTVIANATASPYSGFAPLNVAFSNLSSGVDGSDLSIWNIDTTTFATTFNSNYTFVNDGNYIVTLIVTDIQSGCIDTAMLNIFVDGNISYTIPNIFTPNDDDSNDEFTIISHGITEINVVIYDRWGLKMYEFEGVHGRWDGYTTSGVRVTDGTYFYLFHAVDVNGKEYNEQGHVIIMR